MILLTHEILEEVQDIHAFTVLVKSLAKRASFDNYKKSFPSLEVICDDTKLSKPTVIKAIKYLQDLGLVKVKKITVSGFIKKNQYYITTEKIKSIGNLKLDSPVNDVYLEEAQPVNEIYSCQSTSFTRASKRDLPEPVNDVYSNLKSIEPQERKRREEEGKEIFTDKKKENEIQEITDWDIPEENLDEVLQGIARMFCFTGLFNQPNYFFDKFELRTEFNQAKAYYKQKDKQSRVKSDPATKLISWFKTNKSISEPSLDYTQIKQMSEQDEIAHDLAELNKFTQTMKTYA